MGGVVGRRVQRIRHGGRDRHRPSALRLADRDADAAPRFLVEPPEPPAARHPHLRCRLRTDAARLRQGCRLVPSPPPARSSRVFLASVALTIYLFMTLPTSFFPQEDIGRLTISTQARQDISYSADAGAAAAGGSRGQAEPGVNHVMSTIGGNSDAAANNGTMFVELKDKKERPPLDQTLRESAHGDQQDPRHAGLRHAGPEPALRRPPDGQPVSVRRAGADADQTNLWAGKIQDAMQQDRPFTDVTSDAAEQRPAGQYRRSIPSGQPPRDRQRHAAHDAAGILQRICRARNPVDRRQL